MMTARRRWRWSAQAVAVITAVIATLLAIVTNVATGGSLPPAVERYRGLAWPLVFLIGGCGAGLAMLQARGVPQPVEDAPRQLPPPPSDLVRRSVDLEVLRQNYKRSHKQQPRTPHISLLFGPAGIGKSALAIDFAQSMTRDHPDGQLYASLRGADRRPNNPEEVLPSFLRALHVPPEMLAGDLEQLAALFRSATSDLKILVLLDNAASAAQVRPLLPGGSASTTIITSRTYLTVEGAYATRVKTLHRSQSHLLLARVSGLETIDAQDSAVDDILRYCGDLPLAIRIAGSRLKSRADWNVTDFAVRIRGEHSRLDELRVDDLNVRAALELSYSELPSRLAEAFRLLCIYPGHTFGLEFASAALNCNATEANVLLDGLIDAQLLDVAGDERYSQHDLVRLFAREQLAHTTASSQQSASRGRVVQWYIQELERWTSNQEDPEVPSPGSLDWFDREWIGCLAVAQWALEEQQWPAVQGIAQATTRFFQYRGLWEPLQKVWELALEAAISASDSIAASKAQMELAYALRHRGQMDAAIEKYRVAAHELQSAKRWIDAGQALVHLGELYRITKRHDFALPAYITALEWFNRADARANHASALTHLGATHFELGNYERAIEMYQLAEQIFADAREVPGHTWVQYYFAGVYTAQHRYGDAERRLRAGIESNRARGHLHGQAWFLRALGRLFVLQCR